jgi:hypothetical protein
MSLQVLVERGEVKPTDGCPGERNIAVPRAIWPGIESTYRRNSDGLDRIAFKNMPSQKSRGFIPLCKRRRVYWMTIFVCRSFDWLRSVTEHPIAPQKWKRHAASKISIAVSVCWHRYVVGRHEWQYIISASR